MRREILMALASLLLALPIAGVAGPDEFQRQLIERAHEAKRKLAQAQAAQGVARQTMMREHMQLMKEILEQTRKAQPGRNLTTQQLREWIDEHLALMQILMSQMMDEHHLMMQSMDMSSTMHDMHKKK